MSSNIYKKISKLDFLAWTAWQPLLGGGLLLTTPSHPRPLC